MTHARLAGLSRSILPLSLAILALAGCHKKPAPVPANSLPPAVSGPAPTANITADPAAIDQGQSVVLNWRTTNATSASIDGIGDVPINGTQTVSPATSTNFHFVAKGDGGTADASVRVTVRVPQIPGGTNGSNGSEGDMGSDAAFHASVKDIFFAYDSYTIEADTQPVVNQAAQYLQAHPAVRIVIGGYCDDRGSAEYNITLGEKRADSAKTALVTAGVSPDRIRVISYGKERQFCTEETDACWQQNRRDQFSIDR